MLFISLLTTQTDFCLKGWFEQTDPSGKSIAVTGYVVGLMHAVDAYCIRRRT